MTLEAVTPRRSLRPVVLLQYANPRRMFGVPALIALAVLVISIIVTVAIDRAGGRGTTGNNGGILWSFAGYHVVLGVQMVATTFPFALALGTTRRAFVLGTLAAAALQACYLTALVLLLSLIEKATGGFFLGTRIFSSVFVGGTDPLTLIVTVLLALLCALTVGGVFGAAWTRFGSKGPALISLGLALAGALLLLVLLPVLPSVSAAFRPWWLAIGAVAVIAASAIGEYCFLRRASVR